MCGREGRHRTPGCHSLTVEVPEAEPSEGRTGTGLHPDREESQQGQPRPAQPFIPQQSGRGGPAPATSPAGSDFGISSCQGKRQEKAGKQAVAGASPPA